MAGGGDVWIPMTSDGMRMYNTELTFGVGWDGTAFGGHLRISLLLEEPRMYLAAQ